MVSGAAAVHAQPAVTGWRVDGAESRRRRAISRSRRTSPARRTAISRPARAPRSDGNIGFDTKFGVTPSLNLDVTYRTDFAQVEVDEQQINLTRFNLVFPEKRPFFLENAGLFSVGRPAKSIFFQPAHRDHRRRRPGADSCRRASERQGRRREHRAAEHPDGRDRTDTRPTTSRPRASIANCRTVRALAGSSSERRRPGDLAGPDDWNRTWGVDGKLGVGETLTFNGFAARTETPGLSGRQDAFNGGVTYQNRVHRSVFRVRRGR